MITDALHDCMAAGSTDFDVGPLVPRGSYALSDQAPSRSMSSVMLLVFVVLTDRDAHRAVQFQVGPYHQEPSAPAWSSS
jgi:hypothetical protein